MPTVAMCSIATSNLPISWRIITGGRFSPTSTCRCACWRERLRNRNLAARWPTWPPSTWTPSAGQRKRQSKLFPNVQTFTRWVWCCSKRLPASEPSEIWLPRMKSAFWPESWPNVVVSRLRWCVRSFRKFPSIWKGLCRAARCPDQRIATPTPECSPVRLTVVATSPDSARIADARSDYAFGHPLPFHAFGRVRHLAARARQRGQHLLQPAANRRRSVAGTEQDLSATVLAYNLVVYPFCFWACYRLVGPVWRACRDRGTEHAECPEPGWTRRRALSLPLWAVGLACIGWLPGGILFPTAISYFDVPLDPALFGRFVISFTLSGLIAATYSFFGIEFVVLRILYPYFWPNVRDVQQVISEEIRPQDTRLKVFQFLAGVIPLAGAFLLVAVGPEVSSTRGFRLLLTGLIVLGMVGFGVAMWVNQVLSFTLTVLTRRHGRPAEWSRYMGRARQ